MSKEFQYKPWTVEYTVEDGARLNRLAYQGYDLLTSEPESFRPPAKDYGEYEERPVYGYDDCFPSVRPCPYPGKKKSVPDHGELWQFEWVSSEEQDRLIFNTRSTIIPVRFMREMVFTDSSIRWEFMVLNMSGEVFPFLHVIHPMMRLSEIVDIRFPAFQNVFDGIKEEKLSLSSPTAVSESLLSRPEGTANMWYLEGISGESMNWTYRNGMSVDMRYPEEDFITLGIWWNNGGYPDEDGLRRTECAFEPIPGTKDDLAEAYKDESCLFVGAHSQYSWTIEWKIQGKN